MMYLDNFLENKVGIKDVITRPWWNWTFGCWFQCILPLPPSLLVSQVFLTYTVIIDTNREQAEVSWFNNQLPFFKRLSFIGFSFSGSFDFDQLAPHPHGLIVILPTAEHLVSLYKMVSCPISDQISWRIKDRVGICTWSLSFSNKQQGKPDWLPSSRVAIERVNIQSVHEVDPHRREKKRIPWQPEGGTHFTFFSHSDSAENHITIDQCSLSYRSTSQTRWLTGFWTSTMVKWDTCFI